MVAMLGGIIHAALIPFGAPVGQWLWWAAVVGVATAIAGITE